MGDGGVKVFVNSEQNSDSEEEGMARTFVRNFQQLRKDANLVKEDRIVAAIFGSNSDIQASHVIKFIEEIKTKAGAVSLEVIEITEISVEKLKEKFEIVKQLKGGKLWIALKKVLN